MTGKKVDKNKIIGYQKHNDMPDQFKSYYDSISEHDQKRSIMVEGITQEKQQKESMLMIAVKNMKKLIKRLTT